MKLSQKLTNELIEPFFTEWAGIRESILLSHQLRDGNTEAPMLEGVGIFQQLLAHCEGQASPLNCAERLTFIEQQPARFAAFRQLDELFLEMRKAIASKRVQLKREGK